MKGNSLAGLPLGEQVLAGTKFNVGAGLIRLTGRESPLPKNVDGIQVGARIRKLHILHATQYSMEKKKDAGVAYFTVNYEDQSQKKIAIEYGKDVRNWWYMECEGPCRAEVAWNGASEYAKNTSGATLRLYVMRWTNPAPDCKVVSIDFASAHSEVALFCVAMSVEE